LALFPLLKYNKGILSKDKNLPMSCPRQGTGQDDGGGGGGGKALFGDTADKDRASVRGRNAGGGGREGEAKKCLVTSSTGLYLKRHLLCSSSGSLCYSTGFRAVHIISVLFGLYLDYPFE
jgi:hypothetical protein